MEKVTTTHIQILLQRALHMAKQIDGETVTQENNLQLDLRLQRIANLATHAAQEIEDERLVAVHGMAPV